MIEGLFKLVRKVYNKFVHSIAFFPALMALFFLLLAIVMLELDALGWGENANRKIQWLTLKDAETARTIVSTVAAGIISLTVFSFSMVMIVMNQAASQMSNRLLDQLTGNKVQKLVLGFYIGTVVYALLLLSNISSVGNELAVPVLSIYVLMLLAVADIFLFVYFLHYITESIKYGQLIHRLHDKTFKVLKKYIHLENSSLEDTVSSGPAKELLATQSGYFQGFDKSLLTNLATEKNIIIHFLVTEGDYVLKGVPFINIIGENSLDDVCLKRLHANIDFYYGQEVDKNPYYGFQHLTEVGVKALSPGINDPGTATLSLHALTDLLSYHMQHPIPNILKDDQGEVRIITTEKSFDQLFIDSVYPIWDYGKRDRRIQNAMLRMIHQLQFIDAGKKHGALFQQLKLDVQEAMNFL